MNLKKRLANLDRLTRRQVVPDPAPPALEAGACRHLLLDLGLKEYEGPAGRVWIRDRLDPIAPMDPLPSFAGLFPRARQADPDPEEILFLDTETTGLAGGTGTLAFLLGMSRWRDGMLQTRQLILDSPGQEPALLGALAEWASDAAVTVTYNGASFDLPLLRTRCLMNRQEDPLADRVAWDLLVPARRLWRRRLADCRQQTLESAVCDLPERTGDIEGSRIPAVWFDFLATGATDDLDRVMHHNHLDMIGMAHLMIRVGEIARVITEPGTSIGLDWRDCWSLGRVTERERSTAASLGWMAAAWDQVRHRSAEPRFLADAIRILKRSGDWLLVESVIRWGFESGVQEPWLEREAAILYERRLLDLEKALAHARRSGENSRIERLRRKRNLVRKGS